MEEKTILEKAKNVVILAAEYGDNKNIVKVCAMQCKADSDNYLYKRSTVLFENLDDSILKVSGIIKDADVLIFDNEFTGNILRRYFDFDHKKFAVFYDIAKAILPAEKIRLLNGSKAASDIYSLLYNSPVTYGEIPDLFEVVQKTRKGINAIYRFMWLRKTVFKLRHKRSAYIEHISDLFGQAGDNIAVLNYTNVNGMRTLSGVKPASPTLDQFLATDCVNCKSSRNLVIDFLSDVDTLVIFDDCETELMQHLKEVFGTVPFKFNIINIHKVAGEMFTTAPNNKVDLLNYYLLSFELLYGDYLDVFDRLSEYYSVLQLMLSDYKSTEKCCDKKRD